LFLKPKSGLPLQEQVSRLIPGLRKPPEVEHYEVEVL
jgi:hypothetical protein